MTSSANSDAFKCVNDSLWLTLRRLCDGLRATNGQAGDNALTPIPHAKRMRRATPAGGACDKRGRGGLSFLGSIGVFIALAVPASAVTLPPLPSGQDVSLIEILEDTAPGALWLRLRFLAPEIARDSGHVAHSDAVEDMETLCAEMAVPYVAERGLSPEKIVISLSDRAVPFGQADAAATQFFELFRIENGLCIWEAF